MNQDGSGGLKEIKDRKDVNILEKELKGELGERKRQELLQLHERYRVRRKV